MPTPKPHDPYLALRSRNFRLFLSSNFLLLFGNQMVSTALGWELYSKTGSTLDLGLMGLSSVLPFLVLGLLGGNVADRFDRKAVILFSTFPYLLGLVGLTLASAFHDRIPEFRLAVFAFLFLVGCCNAFYVPAKQALIRQLVPREALPNAVTWGSTAFQTAAVTGPAVCGLLIARIPYSAVYGCAAFFEVLFIGVLFLLRPKSDAQRKSLITLSSLTEGFRFVGKTKPILATITLDLFAVLLGGCMALLPAFVKDILKEGPELLGWMRAAPFLGAVATAYWVSRRPLRRPGTALLWAVAGFGAATIVFGLSTRVWLSLSMMALIGGLDSISVIVRGTLVQMLTPDRLLGRVQSVNYLFINSSNELGAFYSGMMATLLGPVPAVVLGGFASIGIVLLINRLWPQVARLGPLHKARTRT